MPDRIFATQGEALEFLHGLGLKISRAKLSKDYRAGKLRSQSDKTFLEKDVVAYADSLKAPHFLPEVLEDQAHGKQLRQLKSLVLDLCAAIPDLDSLTQTVSKWLAKDDIDPQIAERLAICDRRIARRIRKASEEKQQEKSGNTGGTATAQPITHPEMPRYVSPMSGYWARPHALHPDQIRLPEIPGGYDKIENFDPKSRFCLSGIFAYGSRDDCEKLVRSIGGKIAKEPALYEQTYVVVGTLANPEWSCGFYGKKIEKGLRYREQGGPVKIISEDDWLAIVFAMEQSVEG